MSGRLPIAILLPHSGLTVPPEVLGRVALSDSEVFNEADAHTELLYDFRDDVAVWLAFPYARAILDVNRSDGDNHSHAGDGIVKTQTSYGAPVYQPGAEPDSTLERKLVDRYWRPWHQRLASIAADPTIRLVVDCHTMAAAAPGRYADRDAPRPRACVANLGDRQGRGVRGKRPPTLDQVLARDFAADLGRRLAGAPALAPVGADAAVNAPFAGGWNLWAHAGRQAAVGRTSSGPGPRQAWVMVEVSRGLYIGAQSSDSPVRPPDHSRIAPLRDCLWTAIRDLCEAVSRQGGLPSR